jgi:hypothetical protein
VRFRSTKRVSRNRAAVAETASVAEEGILAGVLGAVAVTSAVHPLR